MSNFSLHALNNSDVMFTAIIENEKYRKMTEKLKNTLIFCAAGANFLMIWGICAPQAPKILPKIDYFFVWTLKILGRFGAFKIFE